MSRGGTRPGAGNPGTRRVKERRQPVTINVLPSVVQPFRRANGKKWAREIEIFMKKRNRDFQKKDHEDLQINELSTNSTSFLDFI